MTKLPDQDIQAARNEPVNHEELEGLLVELLNEIELVWDGATRYGPDIAHDLVHALERRGYTLAKKN